VCSTLDALLLERWAEAATASLERHRVDIDRINVFPVPDGDTGTNMLLTMRSATAAVPLATTAAARTLAVAAPHTGTSPAASPHGAATAEAVASALARGALLGARGNSGVILSQMLRGVAEAVAVADGPGGGPTLTDALVRGARLAAASVIRPLDGTMLTVLAAAAAAADRLGKDRLGTRVGEVAVAAADAARSALHATTGQLPELARAGVVDAGGLGLYLVLDALAALVIGRAPVAELPSAQVKRRDHQAPRASTPSRGYEVTYLLDGANDEKAAALRGALDEVGDAVAVAGDGAPGGTGTWTVHVHAEDIDAALQAGAVAGRPRDVRVVPLTAAPDSEGRTIACDGPVEGGASASSRARAVIVVCGEHVGQLAREAGAFVLECGEGGDVDEAVLARATTDTGARHVALLPCDTALTGLAQRAAAQCEGQDVVVVPMSSPLQGLAALAVHDPARDPNDDMTAMRDAAAATRSGALHVVGAEADTPAGRCRPGDVLGLVHGEVVLVAPGLSVGALWLAARMVDPGAELVTVLLGAGVDDAWGQGVAAQLRRAHPHVKVVVHRGARAGHPLELGVE
jgi:DAK2 domain fusion protein YloV